MYRMTRWFNVVFILALLLGLTPAAGNTPATRVAAAPAPPHLTDFQNPSGPTPAQLAATLAPAAPDAWLPNAGNPGTLDISFRSGGGADDVVNAIAVQPDGQILIVGHFTKYDYDTATRNGIARVSANGLLDLTFEPGAGAKLDYPGAAEVRALALQPDGKIIIIGHFVFYDGIARSGIARLNTDGSLDTTFDTGNMFSIGLQALALQPDGKIIVGGEFYVNQGGVVYQGLARLNADGSLDTTFVSVSVGDRAVKALALQPDGKILIGGGFQTYNGTPRNFIARVNADGSLDTTFGPGSGADNYVSALALQPDGKILIAGNFSTYNGTPRKGIARLNANGSLDTLFNPGTGADFAVNALALQPDGKILIAGDFTTYNGTPRNHIARISAYGALDVTFDPGDGALVSFEIKSLALQLDGKVLVGGDFNVYDNTPRSNLARVNADGSLDTAFLSGGGAGPIGTAQHVAGLAVQPDGKILIAGNFSTYNGVERSGGLARLNTDGSLDTTFAPTSTLATLKTVVLQPDGKILIAGQFFNYNGVPRNGMARLNADGTLDPTFVPGNGFNILALALQPDGKIVAAGTGIVGGGYYLISRFNADGTLDSSFDPSAWAVPDSGGTSGSAYALAIQPDGKIILGGYLLLDDGGPGGGVIYYILRLNPDGSRDATFGAGVFSFEEGNSGDGIYALALQPDGKIIAGGEFDININNHPTTYSSLVRYGPHGDEDPTFQHEKYANNETFGVGALALQPDGKIVVAGNFETFHGVPRHGIARLNPNGSVDTRFDPGSGTTTGGNVSSVLALQPDGKILVGGSLIVYNGISRNRVARLLGSNKIVTPASNVPYGSVVTYTILVDGPLTQTEPLLVFTDTLPVEVDFVQWIEQPAGATVVDDVIHWSGPLAAQDVLTFTFQAQHVGGMGDVVINTAEWSGEILGQHTATADFMVEPPPPLSIAKTAVDLNGAPLHTGDQIRYTVIVTNTTDTAMTGLRITDTLPSGVTFAAAAPGGYSGPNPLVWNVGNLGAHASWTAQITVTVDSGVASIGGNYAQVVSDQDGPRQVGPIYPPGGGDVEPPASGLAIAKTAEELTAPPLLVGDRILYTLRVTNTTTGTLTNLVVTDTLPAGVAFFEVPKGPSRPFTRDGQQVVWTRASLAAGASLTLQVISKATGATPIAANCAAATSAESSTPVTACANVPDANVYEALELLKDAVDLNGAPLLVNDIIRYTIHVTNTHAAVTMTHVVVTDTLPAGTVMVSATHTYTEAGGTLWWQVGSLAPGASWTAIVDQRVDGTVNPIAGNNAAVWSDQQDWQDTGDVYPPDPVIQTALKISKTAVEQSASPLLLNDRILYTIRVTNTTTGTLTNLVVTDTLPAGVTFFEVPKGPSRPFTRDGQQVVWTRASLAAGASLTLQVIGKVDGSANPIGENRVTATCAEEAVPAAAGAQVPGDGVHEPGLVISGTVGGGGMARQGRAPAAVVGVGDLFTYTLTATNSNPALTLHNLVVTVTLPSGAELVNATPPASLLLPSLRWTQPTLVPGASWQAQIVVRQTGAALGAMQMEAASDEQSPITITIAPPGGYRVYLPLVLR